MAWRNRALLLAGAASWLGSEATMASDFDSLAPGTRSAAFTAECVYENESAVRIGARFRHEPSGFVLDVMRIQSVPQAFVWVNSPPPTDQGEPHTLEHLLLGKGSKGRYVASLEGMALGQSSAFTEQRRTCYHFNTAAGVDVFFQLFEEKLDAMLHPTYSDEEIRREVCHFGVTEREDGTLWLEEKGTVYNEMVSTYERPWAGLFDRLGHALYGDGHPLAVSSGGDPSAIRGLTPEEIRAFHASTHHLSNMGAVVSIGDEASLDVCLGRCSEILARVEPGATRAEDPASLRNRLPAPRCAPAGTTVRTTFPHPNPNEPGLLLLAWRPGRDLHAGERYLAELLIDAVAGGQTSNLYRVFVDSETRRLDIGATTVFGWMDGDVGQPVFMGFSNVRPQAADDATLTEVRRLVREELESIAAFPPGSAELSALHERMRGLLLQRQRNERIFLNSPPRFGFRGSGSEWIDRMQRLHEEGGFARNLALAGSASFADSILAGSGNPWAERISAWGLLEEPYTAVATPDPDLLPRTEAERAERIAAFVTELRRRYGVEEDAAAIQRYAADYARATAEIDSVAATIEMPRFIDNPPLTLDDGLRFASRMPRGVPSSCRGSTT